MLHTNWRATLVNVYLTHKDWDKIAPIYRRHCRIDIHEWNLCFDLYFTEISSQGSNWYKASIGSNNGLVLNNGFLCELRMT